jgi:putative transposase
MNTHWFSAHEICGLPGFEVTERHVRNRMRILKVAHRPRSGRGGGREYLASQLPEETQRALMLLPPKRQPLPAPGAIDAAIQTMPVAQAALAPAPAAKLPALPTRKMPSHNEKAVADARMYLVNAVTDMAQSIGYTRACASIALQLSSGQASSELRSMALQANQRLRDDAVSERSLQRYISDYQKGGWWALLPAPKLDKPLEVNEDVAAVLGLYHSTDALYRNLSKAAIDITKQLRRPYDEWRKLYDRARRVLPKISQVDLIKARSTGKDRAAQLPFKRRDTSMLKPLDCWLIDGHTFKAKVRHPQHGAPFAPEVTLAIDAATRKIMGWSASLSENVIAVGDALRHSVGNHGVPAIIYSDNGPGESAKQLDCPVTGVITRLGATHKFGIAGHPQGHGIIERSWKTHMINCARQFGSYQGKDADAGTFRKTALALAKEQRAIARAEQTGEVIQLSVKAPSWQQFLDAVQRSVDEYNGEHRHRMLPKGDDGKRMTPDQMWTATLDAEQQHRLSPNELRMIFMPAMLRQAKRGEVQFLNQTYFSHELMQHDGAQVRVHYDIHDPSFVLIFDNDGQFVCEAKFNGNKIDYFPKPVVQMAREKRFKGIQQRRMAQIDKAMAEMQDVLPATASQPLSLPAQSAASALVLPIRAREQTLVTTSSQAPASSASDVEAKAMPAAPASRPFFDGEADRYEWLMGHRNAWSEADAVWVSRYAASEDYRDLLDYFTSRGTAWEEDQRIEGAR